MVVAAHATPAMSARLRTDILAALQQAQHHLSEILP
jgi:hypothetical protein